MTLRPYRRIRQLESALARLREKHQATYLRCGVAEGWVRPTPDTVAQIQREYDLYDPELRRRKV